MINKEKLIIEMQVSDKKISNILVCILGSILFIFNLIILTINILLLLLTIPISIFGIVILYNYINKYKIEIDNEMITKTNIFNKKKKIGNLSMVTSYSEENSIITVLDNSNKLFTFSRSGGENHKVFYEYLKNNYNFSIYVDEKNWGIILVMFGLLLLLPITIFKYQSGTIPVYVSYFLIVSIIIMIGIDEYIKRFQIIDDKIIYKRLFINKKINITDLTLIKYKKVTGSYRGIKSTTYNIMGYNNDKRLFKISGITPFKFKKIKVYCKEKNIKVKIK